MKNKRFKLCIVSPCYNEAEVIGLFHAALKAVLTQLEDLDHEIILVDDGSSDTTLEVLNQLAVDDPAVTVLSLSRNFGHQVALTAGLERARGDAVIMMDSDLQHPPALIPEMVRCWRDEGFDVVSAVRKRTVGAGLFKRLSSEGFYTLLNFLSDTRIEPGAADFCLLSRRARRALVRMPERHRFLRGMISWMGFRRKFVPYEAAARAAGHSKYSLQKMVRLALDATFSFSVAPIRLGIRLGLASLGLGGIYLAYILLRAAFFGGLVQGWGSLISVVLILGGIQLTLIGLIGEYVGRIFEQVKARPIYLLKQRRRHRRSPTLAESVQSQKGIAR